MAREFKRTDRVGSQMQRDLAILVRDELDDSRLGMITIHEVRVVRDFSHAKVFFTMMGGALEQRDAARLLNEAAPFLRHELGQRMKIRTLPQLHFVYDQSIEQGEKLSALIERAVSKETKRDEDQE